VGAGDQPTKILQWIFVDILVPTGNLSEPTYCFQFQKLSRLLIPLERVLSISSFIREE